MEVLGLLLETFTHDPVSSHGRKHSIPRRSCLPPRCGRGSIVPALWNVNYTDFLPGLNSSPPLRPPPLRPPSPLPRGDRRTAPELDRDTSWQRPGPAGVTEPSVSAAGWRNLGRRQFYCYLAKRANYMCGTFSVCEQTPRFFPSCLFDLLGLFLTPADPHSHVLGAVHGQPISHNAL